MKKFFDKNIVILLISLLFMTGCAHIQPVSTRSVVDVSREVFKNYIIGKSSYVNVGEPIIKVKDFYLTRVETMAMKPSDDFSISKGPGLHEGKQDNYYPIKGEFEYNKKRFKVIHLYFFNAGSMLTAVGACIGDIGILVDQNGNINARVVDLNSGLLSIGSISNINPSNLKFLPVIKESVDTTRGYTNYEILYQGCSGDSIYLTYREYSPDDLARTAFYQNLVYERTAKIIVFRNIRIKVHETTSEGIRYTVLEDGQHVE